MPADCPDLLTVWRRSAELHASTAAVRFEQQELTYRALDARSDRLAQQLVRRGVVPGERVGICLERSFALPLAVLAALKAGAAYVPLDPRYPRARLDFMVKDAGPRLLLTQSELAEAFGFDRERCLCVEPPDASAPVALPVDLPTERLAYVIYTSGSTGEPKGVALGCRALANLIAWQRTASHVGPGARTLQYTPLSFDVHFQELFATWAVGGTLVLVPEELRLDPARLLAFLDAERIERLFLPFIALQSLAEVARSRALYPASLRELITAGEQLQVTPDLIDLFQHLPGCTLHNHYGPSETHVVTAYTLHGDPTTWPTLPPIGTPLPNVTLRLVDEQGQPVDDGTAGELTIAGVALADGYHQRSELTAERFVVRDGERQYRTGDLARRRPDGNYEYLGRADGQVKIRGHRVELGEVEAALAAHPDVRQAAVAARADITRSQQLVGYFVARHGPVDTVELRRFLAARLPDYLVPAHLIPIAELPRTPSGKVDRRALPAPGRERPELAQEFIEPRHGLEETLANIWRTLLRLERVGSHDNFFDLGGNSLLSVQVLTRLREATGHDVPIATFYRFPTIARLAAHLQAAEPPANAGGVDRQVPRTERTPVPGIAIVGMAGRFPGANNIDQLWRNLCAGVESITCFTDEQLDASVPAELRRDAAYVKARGVLDGVEDFDAGFFGIGPREAELMDPQHRLFLETAWHALEHAGCVPERVVGRIGVYAGCHNNSYRDWAVARRPDLVAQVGELQAMVVNEKDYLATRTAYALNLHGPAVSVNTACSTSLVAVVQAVQALLAGQCDVALAGGATVACPQNSGYLAQAGAMLSPDGHCRPFDAAGNGTVFSNGVGVVVLKRVADAQRDGDTIYAVIRGAALNNDGARKMSFSAPAVDGQAEVIRLAHAQAGVSADSLTYVEAHGTATTLGDPVEVEALTQAFRSGTERTRFCALGSVKSNMGHLVAAAGVAGLIKTALALHHEQLPPTLHFRTGNPRIDWERSPFYVCSRFTPWPRGAEPRRAGVSSFGVGGTNAHVVLEEAPAPTPTAEAGEQLVLLSARSATALEQATEQLANYLADTGEPLADVAYTLQAGRRAFSQRRFVVASSATDAAQRLRQPRSRPVETGCCERAAPDVAFLFPGQGTQYLGMGRELYERESAFRAAVDECAAVLGGNVLTAEPVSALATAWAQPALFTFGYALARLWQSWGVQPTILLGHSVGEFVAACLAGVFTLADGLRLVARRAELMQELPSGVMLSVRRSADDVRTWLEPSCALASVNGPALCVASGPEDAIRRLEERCERDQVAHRRLQTSHAFHSPMMDPVVAPFAELVRTIRLAPPRLPILSTVTGARLTAAQATDPAYWAGHLRATVRFADAISALMREDATRVLLEVGPRATLATLARQQAPAGQVIVASQQDVKDGQGERSALLSAAGRLWLAGVALAWPRLHASPRRRLPLPAYPFQRVRCWIEPSAGPAPAPVAPPAETARTAMSSRKPRLLSALRELFEESSGLELNGAAAEQTFLELGLDSLFLTQAALRVQQQFDVPLTFRQLLDELNSLDRLADYLDQRLPAEATTAVPVEPPATSDASAAPADVRHLVAQQLQIMAKQLELLGTAKPQAPPPASAKPPAAETSAPSKPFGAQARITRRHAGLTARQAAALADITRRYNERTRRSKDKTQADRAVLADPRVVSGFRPETKELVYPLIVERSAGSRLWDLDGNEYIDLTCGFGSNFFGYAAPPIIAAVTRQLQAGYEIGPQHPLAGNVARRIAQLTGLPRVVFCNTGSEAVLGAVRLARTATGRQTVALFNGSYHGINDEVIVRPGKQGKSLPAAAGIPPEAVANVLLLDYGAPEALRVLAERGGDLAAVLVEPVQSRHPELQPRDFLHEVRRLTTQTGTALIFDEVITGFRLEAGGAQAYFGVRADLATYGKVIGGGLPIGVIAGQPRFMDGLDGGAWQFGDDSMPAAGVTYFAGTFVRHPLALAAADAVLTQLEQAGPALYAALNARAGRLVRTLNDLFAARGAPLQLESCGSLMKLHYTEEIAYGELLYTLLRLHGLHIWDARPCFLTTAHSDADVERIVDAFGTALGELAPFLPTARAAVPPVVEFAPAGVPGARLGKDPTGRPAWYRPDPERPGKYVKVGDAT